MSKKSVIRKCNEGVSPVIGTILMVAVSVVLAAVLYVTTTGITGSNNSIPPMVSTSKSTDNLNTVWTVVAIAGGSHPLLIIDVYVQMQNETGFIITTEPLLNASGTHGFKYAQASAGDYLGVGDTFSLDKAYTQGCKITLVNPSATVLYGQMIV